MTMGSENESENEKGKHRAFVPVPDHIGGPGAKTKRVVEDIRSLFPPSYDMQHLNGFVFVDADVGALRLLVTTRGEYNGWVCYQEPDGSWTPAREATRGQLLAMVRAFAAPKVVAL